MVTIKSHKVMYEVGFTPELLWIVFVIIDKPTDN